MVDCDASRSRRGFLLGASGLLATWAVPARAAVRRLATTELVLTQTALALGIVPVAVGNAPLYGRLVERPELPPSAADLGPLNEPNLEVLQYLKPDLIFAASWQRATQGSLERIARVVWLDSFALDGKPLANGFRLADHIAGETGRRDAAAALRQETQNAFASARDRLAASARQPVYVVRFLDDGRHLAVFGSGSLVAEVLAEIGVENAWTGRSNVFGGAFVGIERLTERPDAIVLSFGRVGEDPAATLATLAKSPLWRAMPFVRENRVFPLAPFFPAGGLPSAARLAEAISAAICAGALP